MKLLSIQSIQWFASAGFILSILLEIHYGVDQANAECCYSVFQCKLPKDHPSKRCADCEIPSVYCGVGKCNIFGCNCDGGCRKGNESFWCWNKQFCDNGTSSELESFDAMNQEMVLMNLDLSDEIRAHDTNGDGSLNQHEFSLLTRHVFSDEELARLDMAKEFSKLDRNQDSKISIQEIDSDLV